MSDDARNYEWVSVRRFHEMTGISKTLIYDLLRRGTLEGFQLDGTTKWVVRADALQLMRDQQERARDREERQ